MAGAARGLPFLKIPANFKYVRCCRIRNYEDYTILFQFKILNQSEKLVPFMFMLFNYSSALYRLGYNEVWTRATPFLQRDKEPFLHN